MFSSFLGKIRDYVATNPLPKVMKQTKTLFVHSSQFNYCQMQNILQYLKKDALEPNLTMLLITARSTKDWVVQLKMLILLINLLRRENSLADTIQEYLTTQKCLTSSVQIQKQSTSSEVYTNILQNIKTYLLKICQDIEIYQEMRKKEESWLKRPACSLYKIINITNFLLSTKATFTKLLKDYDITSLFTELFRVVVEDLEAWFQYYSRSLTNKIEGIKDFEYEELLQLENLYEEGQKLYSRTNLMLKMVQIYRVAIPMLYVTPIKVTVQFKLSLQKSKKNESTKAGSSGKSSSFVRKAIEIDSIDRSFKEDEALMGDFHINSRKNQRLNKSVLVVRQFRQQL